MKKKLHVSIKYITSRIKKANKNVTWFFVIIATKLPFLTFVSHLLTDAMFIQGVSLSNFCISALWRSWFIQTFLLGQKHTHLCFLYPLFAEKGGKLQTCEEKKSVGLIKAQDDLTFINIYGIAFWRFYKVQITKLQ